MTRPNLVLDRANGTVIGILGGLSVFPAGFYNRPRFNTVYDYT